ncbi:MAG: DegV family protein [Bacillota bacterium]
MASIKIVTDSTSDLTKGRLDELGVQMIPLTVNFGDTSQADKLELSTADFWQRLIKVDELPTTSQPAVGEFKQCYQELALEYDTIISLHLASELSGTYQTAKLAASAVAEKQDVEIKVIDSKSVSLGLGFLVEAAALAVRDGDSAEQIIDRIKQLRNELSLLFSIDTLDYLKQGGRIGKAAAFLGNLFNIKPILQVNDRGEVDFHSKVRGEKRLFKKLKHLVKHQLKKHQLTEQPRLALLHGRAADKVDKLRSELIELADWKEVVITEIGPVIGTHVGPGALGIVIL